MTELVTNNVWAADGDSTATIKFGRGHDDPWLVFKGSPSQVKAQIVDAFSIEAEEANSLTLAELVVNVSQTAQSMRNASAGLGGRVIGNNGRPKSGSDEVWRQADKPAEPVVNPLYAEQEACTSVDELKALWARNRDAYDNDAELFAAWKAKGKALSEAVAA